MKLRGRHQAEHSAPELVLAIKEGREVLPGRGLGDPDYKLPWGTRA